MPSKCPENALLHIRDNIFLAMNFIEGLDYEAFKGNRLVVYGVTRCLEIISEASRRLPHELKARHLDIPWPEMAAAGNVYRHDYEDVGESRLWGTIQERFPALLAVVEQELGVSIR